MHVHQHLDDDEESVDSSHEGSVLERPETASGNDKIIIASAETKALLWWKMVVMTVLLLSALVVAMTVYRYTSNSETSEFEDQFNHNAVKIFEAIGSTLDMSLGSIDSFLVSVSSFVTYANMTWPFVTIPDYYVRTSKIRSLSKSFICSQYHFIKTNQRKEWEDYSFNNDGWVSESIEMQKDDPSFTGKIIEEYQKSPIFVFDVLDGPLRPEGYFPQWQSSPVVPYYPPYNWDGYSYDAMTDALPHLLDLQVVISKVPNAKPDINNPEQVQKYDQLVDWAKDFIHDDEDPSEPFSEMQYPIIEDSNKALNIRNDEKKKTHRVVGVFSITFFWRHVLSDILSESAQGIVCVIGNECGQMFTYEIDGSKATYLGEGNLHDERYDHLEKFTTFDGLKIFREDDKGYTGLPISNKYCPYWIRVYPSRRTEDENTTTNPVVFTVSTVLIFLFTSLVFFIYDLCVEHRQRKVMKTAVQSTAIVSSLFPSNVRDRLFITDDGAEQKGGMEAPKNRWKSTAKTGASEHEPFSTTATSPPVADFFPETTVLFADIAGFTAWCSVREPAQVFLLLESIYGAFDGLARRRGVFKVETIGDSYVAVMGLPEPCKDHALVMAKFARDCRENFNQLVKNLEVTLGPDTGDLQMRFGLHSGAVTAGVLRGEKGRFQLFGDTVNTAARMESNGIRNRIHVSQTTADLLIKAGKANWIKPREDLVEAKGKGKMQTYWVEPTAKDTKTSSYQPADPAIDQLHFDGILDDRMERLVDWHVEILMKLIRQIVARRNATSQSAVVPEDVSQRMKLCHDEDTILDEVKEIIEFPEFDAEVVSKQQSTDSIVLESEVIAQLRDYVRNIAAAYHQNPFHNFEHAAHVTMSVAKLLSRIVAPVDIQDGASLHDHTYGITSDPLTQFACVFSSLIHDVDHQGVPNNQLVKENAYIASVYKNRSVAEQNSVEIAWNLFMDSRFDALRDAICKTPAEMSRFRQLVVNSVMATDIMDKDLKALRNDRWDTAFKKCLTESRENRNRKATIVLEHLIQASDIAHTMQHWHVYRKWNERLFMEMYVAYQRGRAEKDPSTIWYEAEIGFFDFYIIPLAKKLSDCGVFGVSSHEYLDYANKNKAEWELRGKEVVASMLAKVKRD